jgi:hypothetical protein
LGTVSDECVTVVEMSIGPLEAADRADAVIGWLLDTGVIVPNPARDSAWRPSAYLPGPQAPTAAPGFSDADYTLANNGVDIVVERELYRDTTPHRPPSCPDCGHELAEATLEDLIRPWLDDREPHVTCPGCGAVRPLGDWPDGYLVGELAVRFNNWPPLADEFVAALGTRMGPRWRAVHEHY